MANKHFSTVIINKCWFENNLRTLSLQGLFFLERTNLIKKEAWSRNREHQQMQWKKSLTTNSNKCCFKNTLTLKIFFWKGWAVIIFFQKGMVKDSFWIKVWSRMKSIHGKSQGVRRGGYYQRKNVVSSLKIEEKS